MVENLKNKIWEMLKEKEISLAMIFNKKGEILWQKGREVTGDNIFNGKGFSRSYAQEAMLNEKTVFAENAFIKMDKRVSKSTEALNVKDLAIIPICKQYFLYLDSGTTTSFSKTDLAQLSTIGELLGEMIDQIKIKADGRDGLIGESIQTKNIREQITDHVILEENILITGETGTGKSYIAELIHQYSGCQGKFVVVNTPGIPESLFESELFGHKKGAFTGAEENRLGLVAEAEAGTLFFDEIAEINNSLQAKLLRLIETKKYKVLGETSEKVANTKIIAATNQNLEEAIKNNKFRKDLYYRLCGFEIIVPPLRERKADIKPLVLHFKSFLKGKNVGEGFFETLQQYDWPGNVRELIHILKFLGSKSESPITDKEITKILGNIPVKISVDIDDNTKTKQLISQIKSGKSFWEVVQKPYTNHDLTREDVRKVINECLSETRGKYIDLLKMLNLPKNDYQKFMNFLFWNQLRNKDMK